MNFDDIIRAPCLVKRPAPDCPPSLVSDTDCCADPEFAQANPTVCNQDDERCAEAGFAQANPTLCANVGRLILKPEYAIREPLGQVRYQLFLLANGEESEISGEVFATSNAAVAAIGASSGNATAFLAGIATISATWQGLTAHAQIEVVASCRDRETVFAIVIDNSSSMDQAFSSGYATKLSFAKEQARRFVDTVDLTKDKIAVFSFAGSTVKVLSASQNADAIKAAIQSIAVSAAQTNINGALGTAISYLDDATDGIKAVVLFSDGANKFGGNPIPTAIAFRQKAGVIMVVGIRASNGGFTLLDQIASGGFFINAYGDVEDDVYGWLAGLKSYICSGNCTKPGDVTVGYGTLNFTDLTNWDVSGVLDLIGSNGDFPLFDFLPGNGLYLDLSGSSAPWDGGITSKTTFALQDGYTYRLRFKLAGNQRCEHTDPYVVRAKFGDGSLLNEEIEITNYIQDFTEYSFDFVAGSGDSGKILIEQITRPASCPDSFGVLLDSVVLEESQSGNFDDTVTLLSDNFDDENPTYISPNCKNNPLYYYGPSPVYGECYAYGCLDTPLGAQVPDPDALEDIEGCLRRPS